MKRPLAAPQAPPSPSPAEGVRLSKRMAELGLASRREADEWIARGWVRVDGRVVAELARGCRLPRASRSIRARATRRPTS